MGTKKNGKTNTELEPVVIPGTLIERIVTMCEKGIEKNSEINDVVSKEVKNSIVVDEGEFIKEELKRIKDKMKKTNIASDEYESLIRIYDKMMDVIRWW